VILVVSPNTRERIALVAVCESRGWVANECDSIGALTRRLRRSEPKVILCRQRLLDGFSDDVIAAVRQARFRHAPKIVVLASATLSSAMEARQISLGADLVQRDPVRIEVLAEYLAKFQSSATPAQASADSRPAPAVEFAGALVQPLERTARRGGDVIALSPREVQLVELLAQSPNSVVTYEVLYSEILGRKFRGETSNMRVLLGMLDGSYRSLGLALRKWVEVIPKSGYRYWTAGVPASLPQRPQRDPRSVSR
jgi:DNA-binding response OmpR family regulator